MPSPHSTNISPRSPTRTPPSPPPTSASSPSRRSTARKTAGRGRAYLKSWPKSPYRAQVQLLEAQELSREKKFADALPLWENLANEPATAPTGRTSRFCSSWPAPTTSSAIFPRPPRPTKITWTTSTSHPSQATRRSRKAHIADARMPQARLAVCLQKSDQLLAATEAWKAVQSLAPDGSPEQEDGARVARPDLRARAARRRQQPMVDTFRKLLDKFPNSPLRAMAAFSVGDRFSKSATTPARSRSCSTRAAGTPKTWQQPATQRLVLAAFGMKNYNATVGYLKEYDTIPAPADPQAAIGGAASRSAVLLARRDRAQAGKLGRRGDLLPARDPAPRSRRSARRRWWELGEVQSQRKEWPAGGRQLRKLSRAQARREGRDDGAAGAGPRGTRRAKFRRGEETRRPGAAAGTRRPAQRRGAHAAGRDGFRHGDFPEAARLFARSRCSSTIPKSRRKPWPARPMPSSARAMKNRRRSAGNQKSAYPQFQESDLFVARGVDAQRVRVVTKYRFDFKNLTSEVDQKV